MSLWLDPALPSEVDVVVIGGGIAGVSVAYQLAREGVSVALFESRQIGSGASGRNDGQLLLGLGEHYNRIVSQFGTEKARMLWEFIRDNNNNLKTTVMQMPSVDLQRRGGIRMAETEQEFAELQEAADLLHGEGRVCGLLSKQALCDILPVRGFHGALTLQGEAIVQPAEMTKGIARLAVGAGAKIYERQQVVDIVDGNDSQQVVILQDGRSVRTYMVVHCTAGLGTHLDKSGFLKSQIFPYRGQIIATDPLDGSKASAFDGYAMSSNFCYEYFRTYQNQFIIGGMRWSVKGQEEHTTDDTVINPDITANLKAYVDKHLPTLNGVDFPYSWSGIMAGTNDGLPLVGAIPGQSGSLALLAFNGYGLSFAYRAAEVIKDYVVDGKSSAPASSLFNPRRFIND